MEQLNDRILEVLKKLREQTVQDMVNYDVKEEWGENIVINAKKFLHKKGIDLDLDYSALSPWQKMCCYKNNGLEVDCDVALRSVVIYALAFSFVQGDGWRIQSQPDGDKYCISNGDENLFEYRGDTMNSYATAVHRFIVRYDHDEKEVEYFLDKVQQGWGTDEKYKNIRYHWEACILEKYKYFDRLLPLCGKEFIRLNDTLGNFLPVPGNFNAPRYSKTNDYWDLTLLGIWEYYVKGKCLHSIIGGNSKPYSNQSINIEVCETWLRIFGEGWIGWDNFVERNFLQDFVNSEQGNHRYGCPKELWKQHFSGKLNLEILGTSGKPDYTQFFQFFTNTSAWITARGIRIALKVKEVLDSKTDEQLLNELCQGLLH